MSPKLDNLLISPKSRAEAELFIRRPGHALMISGLPGSGKSALARALAAAVLATDNLDNYPYFTVVSRPEGKKDIPIEDIRAVIHSLRLRTTGRQSLRRVIFIEDAQYLSTEAQNALLKAIEEPASDTAFILSVPSARSVLPTITSRASTLQIGPVNMEESQHFYGSKYPQPQLTSAWQLSQGRAGLLNALLDQDSEHPLKQAVETAKSLLSQTTYERLLELDKLSKDKERFSQLLDALDKVLGALQRANIARGKSPAAILKSRRLVAKSAKALAANTSARLTALELALNLKV